MRQTQSKDLLFAIKDQLFRMKDLLFAMKDQLFGMKDLLFAMKDQLFRMEDQLFRMEDQLFGISMDAGCNELRRLETGYFTSMREMLQFAATIESVASRP